MFAAGRKFTALDKLHLMIYRLILLLRSLDSSMRRRYMVKGIMLAEQDQ